jgi:glycosyltransferase involved in cell wall biosynthesis
MTIIAYVIFFFTLIQMVVAFINLVTETSLPEPEETSSAFISVLIPVRNEENNIGNILNDLLDQEYKEIEIILFDDQSEDDSASIINEFVLKDNRIKLVRSDSLPDGWLGKNHACHSLAEYAKGEYLLFLDADVRISGNPVGKALSFARKYDLSLISVFPKQNIISAGEKISVPNMNYILVSLLPLILVRKSKYASLAAANGQFMFFRATDYYSVEPHKLMRNQRVEDIHIARYFKTKGLSIACLLGDEDISCRMYGSYREATNGFSKNVVAFFGNSFLIASLFWLITTFGFFTVVFFLSIWMVIVYFSAYLLTRIFVSVASRQNIFFNSLLIIPLQISLGYFIYKAIINKSLRRYQWKGRSIS